MLEELIFPSFSSSGTIKVEASSKNGSLSKSSIKKKKKKFTQCSLKVSFQGQENPKKYKNPNKMQGKIWDFS